MKIQVFSRQMAENPNWVNEHCKNPYVWISIGDPPITMKGEPIVRYKAKPYQNHLCMGVLFVNFFDLPPPNRGIISDDDARRIVEFVHAYKNHMNLVCIHCEAGVSRSPGVAAALDIIFNSKDDFTKDQRYLPNLYVKNMILKAANLPYNLREKRDVFHLHSNLF